MIKLFTIGFTGKPAAAFFNLLRNADVKTLVDTRLNNKSQLAGFAKGSDLDFFTREICDISYEHNLDYAPTKELLSQYRKKIISWEQYETDYLNLLDLRKVSKKTNIELLHEHCLLCSEHTPDKCHRRLLAEYFKHTKNEIEIVHLIR
jgi:uncharacterized protein (DUF488 family)